MARKSNSVPRVWPEDSGGMGTWQAKTVIEEMLTKLDETVQVGHWNADIRLHKVGFVVVKLEVAIWKKGWSPPQEAVDAELARQEKKTDKAALAKKAKEVKAKVSAPRKKAKKASSRKPPKKAR
jgi:hypothetical protein